MEQAGSSSTVVITGMVTSYDEARGYGFVAQGGGRELFVEPTAINITPRMLELGAKVIVEVIQHPNGPRVASVRKF